MCGPVWNCWTGLALWFRPRPMTRLNISRLLGLRAEHPVMVFPSPPGFWRRLNDGGRILRSSWVDRIRAAVAELVDCGCRRLAGGCGRFGGMASAECLPWGRTGLYISSPLPHMNFRRVLISFLVSHVFPLWCIGEIEFEFNSFLSAGARS